MRKQVDPERVMGVCRRYPVGSAEGIRPFGDGHINETFLAECSEGRFICQRLQRKMDPNRLEYNYSLYSKALEHTGLRCPEWLRRMDTAEFFYTDAYGDCWRMYPFLEGEIPAPPLTKEVLYACGAGLARFHLALKDLPEQPVPVYPMLHDLAFYLEEYRQALCSPGSETPGAGQDFGEGQSYDPSLNSLTQAPRATSIRDRDIEKWIEAESPRFLNLDLGRKMIIHGDPKLDNILMQSGKVTAFVDLDTIMPGSALEDLADLIRSAVSAQKLSKSEEGVPEERTSETRITERIITETLITENPITENHTTETPTAPLISRVTEAVTEGYLSVSEGAKPLLSPSEISSLPEVVRKLYFELTVRYYTDHLLGGRHFHEKYPGYLLEKARYNLTL